MSHAHASSWIQRLRSRLSGASAPLMSDLHEEMQIRGREIRIPIRALPMDIAMGKTGHFLRLVPEHPIYPDAIGAPAHILLLDPERYYDHAGGCLRLEPGASLVLGRYDEQQMRLFQYPQGINQRHLSINHMGAFLVIKDLHTDHGTRIRPVRSNSEIQRHRDTRLQRLNKVREIYGGPLRTLERNQALALLKDVNLRLSHQPLRPTTTEGHPGSVVQLPATITPVIIGDLHGRVDNLLKVLAELPILEGMEREDHALIILGDAIHPEDDGQLESMDSSMLMMDLILKLKQRFPKRFFYLLGNHDGFSHEILKSGVPQGALWEHHIRFHRGEAFKLEMDHFYQSLATVLLCRDLVACHAAPTIAQVTLEMLVNLAHYPGLRKELIWNRLHQPHCLAGYTHGDVKRFRRALNLPPQTTFIVAHNPLGRDEERRSVWLDVGNIPHHHIVFSGLTQCIGLFTRIGGHFTPRTLPTEALLPMLDDSDQDATPLPEKSRAG